MLGDWVVVLDADEASLRQLDVCRVQKPDLQGAILCNDEENRDAAVCTSVTHFPAFCHVPTNACVYGLRTSADDFEELRLMVPPSQPPPPPADAPLLPAPAHQANQSSSLASAA